MKDVQTSATLRCPSCGWLQAEEMPEDACLWYWQCPGCGELHRPLAGDCCVFCSYGSVPCPPLQRERAGSGSESG